MEISRISVDLFPFSCFFFKISYSLSSVPDLDPDPSRLGPPGSECVIWIFFFFGGFPSKKISLWLMWTYRRLVISKNLDFLPSWKPLKKRAGSGQYFAVVWIQETGFVQNWFKSENIALVALCILKVCIAGTVRSASLVIMINVWYRKCEGSGNSCLSESF